ncbi:hypothetical protein SRB5_66980 [Streptomyces sp. RB5]|uniref:Uncharacterized protein n=1 Tax=Streptomyces smaragdinus TaxID=2585196 RepID=A0A7K0CSQ8_9ACTN|nr:hypothetical protein [Streptomyces smaragdinus]
MRHQGELHGLGVHRERVPPQPQRAALPGQVGAVAQGAGGLLAGGRQPAVELVAAHPVADGAQLRGDGTDPGDERVGGEEGVDLVRRGERGGPAPDGAQHPPGGRHEPVGAPGPLVELGLLARGEGLVHLLPPGRELLGEALERAEPGLQVLQPQQQPAELPVAFLRRAGRREAAGHGLPEQRGLGRELGLPLAAQQLPAPSVQHGAAAVDGAEDLTDTGQHGGADGRVGDVEGADDLGHGAQGAGQFGDPVGERPGGGDRGDLARLLRQLPDRAVAVGEGVLAGQEADRAAAGRVQRLGERGGQLVDTGLVGVPDLAQRLQPPLRLPQPGEPRHPAVRRPGRVGAGTPDQPGDVGRRRVERRPRLPPQLLDALELADDLPGGGPYGLQRLPERAGVGVAEPVVAVGDPGGRRGDPLEHGAVGGQSGGGTGHRQGVGDAPYEVGVADPGQRAGAGGAGGGVRVGDERRAPDLHRVDPGGLLPRRPEHGHRAVVGQRPAVRLPGCAGLLADHVVRQQQRAALGAGVEDVQHVLAVRGAQDALVLQVRGVRVEGPGGAAGRDVGEVVPAGEDDPLVLGQPAAGPADAVEADDLAGAGVEDEVAAGGLVVREDPQQDEGAGHGVVDLEVGEGLQRLVDRLAVGALAGLGVVPGLQRERPAGAPDEHQAPDGDMGVAAGDVVGAGGGGPFDVVRLGEDVLALTPVVDVRHGAVGRLVPAQDAQVGGRAAGLEHGEQGGSEPAQLEQPGVAVEAVQLGEVPAERGVVEQSGDGVLGRRVEADAVGVVALEGEDVGHLGGASGGPVVAEQQQPAGPDEVPGHAVVPGADQPGAGQLGRGAAERLDPAGVEPVGPVRQLPCGGGQPVAQNLVRAGGQLRLHLTSPRRSAPPPGAAPPRRCPVRRPAAGSAPRCRGRRWPRACPAVRPG